MKYGAEAKYDEVALFTKEMVLFYSNMKGGDSRDSRNLASDPSRRLRQAKVRTRILELQAQVESQSVTAAALTLDAHLEKLRELRDEARQRGQLSAAIQAEVKRGEAGRFYVKQVETGDAGNGTNSPAPWVNFISAMICS